MRTEEVCKFFLTKTTSEFSSFKMKDDSGDKRLNWNMSIAHSMKFLINYN